jgi:hypothetical protein
VLAFSAAALVSIKAVRSRLSHQVWLNQPFLPNRGQVIESERNFGSKLRISAHRGRRFRLIVDGISA